MNIKCVVIAAGLVAFAAPLFAHDMWIEPTSFAAVSGQIIGLKLRVGDNFMGDPIRRDPELIHEFISVDSTGRKPVYGRDGADPAGLVRVTEPGLLIFGYQSRPRPVVLTGAKFNQYLREESLENIAKLRARRNQTGKEAREIFTRCAKSLVNFGMPTGARADRALGFTLELVAESDADALRRNLHLPVRLLYEGRPLADVLVVAMSRANPAARVTGRTDKRGRAALKLPNDGIWLIKAVHMVPAPAGTDAEWSSFWASLTLEVK